MVIFLLKRQVHLSSYMFKKGVGMVLIAIYIHLNRNHLKTYIIFELRPEMTYNHKNYIT